METQLPWHHHREDQARVAYSRRRTGQVFLGAYADLQRSRHGGSQAPTHGGAPAIIQCSYFDALEDDPADPERYARTCIAQISKADIEVFRMLGKDARPPFVSRAPGDHPLEHILDRILAPSRIQQILAPVPHANGSAAATSHSGGGSPSDGFKQVQQLLSSIFSRLGNAANNTGTSHISGGGGGKHGKGGKGDRRGAPCRSQKGADRTPVPKDLVGMHAKTSNREPCCFNFNLKGCDKAGAGQHCDKGWHQCMLPACKDAQTHGLQQVHIRSERLRRPLVLHQCLRWRRCDRRSLQQPQLTRFQPPTPTPHGGGPTCIYCSCRRHRLSSLPMWLT